MTTVSPDAWQEDEPFPLNGNGEGTPDGEGEVSSPKMQTFEERVRRILEYEECITRAQISQCLGISISTLRAWTTRVAFPPPVTQERSNAICYRPEEVAAFCKMNGMQKEIEGALSRKRRRVEASSQKMEKERLRDTWQECTEEECAIYTASLGGATEESLAEGFHLSPEVIRRSIARMRMQRLFDLPLAYIYSKAYAAIEEGSKEEHEVQAPAPGLEFGKRRRTAAPAGIPPDMAHLYETPLLNPEQEQHLFRQMNYLKFRAATVRSAIDLSNPDVPSMEKVEGLYARSEEVRNELTRRNLRLVVYVAKLYVTSRKSLDECISEGNQYLIKAVEKFDCDSGNKFSTYAAHTIHRGLTKLSKSSIRFVDHERCLDSFPDSRSHAFEDEARHAKAQAIIPRLLAYLDEREQVIIRGRYALPPVEEKMTLTMLASQLGVSKERVRQLLERALMKMQEAAAEGGMVEALEPFVR